jgi:arginase family enzyme
MACSWRAFHRFEQEMIQRIGSDKDAQPVVTFVGSGDFHHISLALLHRQPGPINLLVIDKHPDWMRRMPFLHCGTWLYHAAKLPQVQFIFHVGGDLDFDNAFRLLAPWRELHCGKIVVIPAIRKYTAGAWPRVPHRSLRNRVDEPVGRYEIEEMLDPYRAELGDMPLYISLDKDVMTADEAPVNWDSGHLNRNEVFALLSAFRGASGGVAGMDIVGDWSPVAVKGIFRRFLHLTEHPAISPCPENAKSINERLNGKLLDWVRDTRQVVGLNVA